MASLPIDIVVPTYNGWELSKSCLHHLAAQTVAHRVIVADNGSQDGTPERLAAVFPEATVLALGENRGFGAACNAGVRAGQGETIVLLNNDVDAAPDFVERLVAPLTADDRLGTVAPLLVRPDGARIDSIGLAADPTLAGFPRLQGRPVAEATLARPELLGPTGGGAAYRRRAWEQVGGMDERIFLYQEDVDLALRLRAAGWGTTTAPDAVGVHLGSATAGRRSAWQRQHAAYARGYLVRRYGLLRSRAAARTVLTEALVAGGDAVMSRDLAAARGRVQGWRAARGLPSRAIPDQGIDRRIGLRTSIALRRADYVVAATG
jgi:GT2 family glycosyltransferase